MTRQKKVELTFFDRRCINYLKSRDAQKAQAIINAAFPDKHVHGNPKRKKEVKENGE